jgi:hypothetical protein
MARVQNSAGHMVCEKAKRGHLMRYPTGFLMNRNKDMDVILILTSLFCGTSLSRRPLQSKYLLATFSTGTRLPESQDVLQTSSTHRLLYIRHPAANCEYILITIFMIMQLNSVYFGFTSIRSRSTIYKSVKLDKNCSSPIQCMSLFPPKRIPTAVLYPRNRYHVASPQWRPINQ